jgi:hypothetical protein
MGELKETNITKLTEAEAAYSLREGWKLVFGEYPGLEPLAILWAQSALETGRWKHIYNYNFGNIKRHNMHDWCMYKCSEIINGKNVWFVPPDPQTHFSSYSSMIEGAKEYIEFVSKRPRYKEAWQQLVLGKPVGYCVALKKAGYFTAALAPYAKSVVMLCDEFKNKSSQFLTYSPPVIKEIAALETKESTIKIEELTSSINTTLTTEKLDKNITIFQTITQLFNNFTKLFIK